MKHLTAPQNTTYYPYTVRWQQRDGFLLWVNRSEPERESFWTNQQKNVPLFANYRQLYDFVLGLGYELTANEQYPVNLDAVVTWLGSSFERPPAECLVAWSLFDDLSAGLRKSFMGNRKSLLRNRVFDLLYAENGPYLDSGANLPWQMPQQVQWNATELKMLRQVLAQGVSLWQNNVFWQEDAH